MKANTFKIVSILLIVIFSFTNCSVDDYTIQGRSTKENLIKNESSARSALAGIYETIRPNNSRGFIYAMMSLSIAGTEQQVALSAQNSTDIQTVLSTFYKNDVKPVPANRRTGGLLTFYQKSFVAINLANFFIKIIEEKGIKGTSKKTQNQIIAEAKALRAHSYFQLLRVFGQFYNPESEYGVITTTEVITNSTYLKRNKVSKTYDLIIKDLEFAIQYIPNNNPRYYVTQEYAKGLLAKVYLYKGGKENWSKTVNYCSDIINKLGSKFNLASDFSDIFIKGIESAELIFSPYYNSKKGQTLGGKVFPINDQALKPSKYFKTLADTDPRYNFTYVKRLGSNTTLAYNKYPTDNSVYYFLRVAEVYLMYAEAVARTDGNMQDALSALNKIRARAGVPIKTFTDKATLLEDIRKEKMLELHIENAQSWFDLVRYHILGDLDATKLKSSIKNVNQFIFPIPERVRRNNTKFGPQNPGY